MLKKELSLLALCVAVAATITACGSSKTDTGGSTTSQSAKPEAKKDPVELVFYTASGDYNEETFAAMFGNKIKEKFPHVTPKFINYSASNRMDKMLTSGQTFDILFYSSGQSGELIDYDLQYDISPLIKQYNFDLSKMEPTSIDIQRKLADGGIYGLPVFTSSLTTYYNKDLFDKFGVKYPKDGMTWDEMYELAKLVSRTDGSTKYPGMTLSPNHSILLNQLSVPYVDPQSNKVTYTTDNFRKLIDTWSKFYTIPGNEVDAKTVDYGPQVNMFDKDKVASMFIGLSTLGTARFKDAINWDVVSYPVYKDKPAAGPQSYPTYFYVTKTTSHKEQAFEVIAYLASEEFQKYLTQNGLFPTLKNYDTVMKEFGANVPYLKGKNVNGFLPKTFTPSAVSTKAQLSTFTAAFNNLVPSYNAILLGQKDSNTALREAEEKTNKAVADLLAAKK